MKTTQTRRPAPQAPADWHPFSWTKDGHTPKIDVRTPADIKAAKLAGTL